MNKLKMNKIQIIICIIVVVLIVGVCSFFAVKFLNKDKEIDEADASAYDINTYIIYGGDDNAENIIPKSTIELENNKSLIEKLDAICEELNFNVFKDVNLNIVTLSVQSIPGETDTSKKGQFLTINLRDGQSKKWIDYLDSGSAGSSMVVGTIVNSFLQNEIQTDNWIYGLKILLNGEENVEGNHFSFNQIFYRTTDGSILQ